MNLKTLSAKLHNFFNPDLPHVQLGRLKSAAEGDHGVAVVRADTKHSTAISKAEAALGGVLTTITTEAKAELTAIERSVQMAARRANGLLNLGVLEVDHTERAAKIANQS